MKLRMNLFGVVMDSGLALTIGAILMNGHVLLSLVFFVIASYPIMHLKRVDLLDGLIQIRYPLALIRREVMLPPQDLISYRFSGGHYTESGSVFVKYRRGERENTLTIPVDASERLAAESWFRTWFPNHEHH